MVVEDSDFNFTLKPYTNTNILSPIRKHKTAPPIISNGNHHHHHYHRPPAVEFSSTADFELFSLKKSPSTDSYTSLKDIIPSSPCSILSPTPAATFAGISSSSFGSGYEISIRNRLVKQAAWAYLQPAVLSSPSSSSRRLHISGNFFRPMIDKLWRFVSETVSRAYDWLVDALWLILCR